MSHKDCKVIKLIPEHNPKRKITIYPEPEITKKDVDEFFDKYIAGADPVDDYHITITKKSDLKIKKDE